MRPVPKDEVSITLDVLLDIRDDKFTVVSWAFTYPHTENHEQDWAEHEIECIDRIKQQLTLKGLVAVRVRFVASNSFFACAHCDEQMEDTHAYVKSQVQLPPPQDWREHLPS